jgi:hypothetical protein
MRRRLAAAVAVLLAVPAVGSATAHAFRLPLDLAPVRGNPAHKLAHLEPDAHDYDRARRCDPKPKPGVTRFTGWLRRNARGVLWGTYRCEKWGEHEASLHAEGRAVDWHLDASRPLDRLAARALIRLLLAPDTSGTPHALARRMGLSEIIWDCSYWGAGMPQFVRYRPCFDKHGKPRRRVDRTLAHRDHIHFGFSRAGAAGRTTFWHGRSRALSGSRRSG